MKLLQNSRSFVWFFMMCFLSWRSNIWLVIVVWLYIRAVGMYYRCELGRNDTDRMNVY